MDKRQSVIESIQKLLALNVSDSEIAENLFDVGISKEDATNLIIEAKGVKSTPAQSTGTFNANSGNLNNSSTSKQNAGTLNKPSLNQNNSSSSIPLNQNPSGKSSKAVFDETVTKLSMNDEVISQIPFNKQKTEKEVSQKISPAQSDAIAKRIISDVANQSDPKDVGEDVIDDSNSIEQNKEEVNEEEPIEKEIKLDSKDKNDFKLNKTSSVNDEESEDEFENNVKKTLFSAKKPFSFDSTKFKNFNSNLNNASAKYVPSISLDSSPDFEELWKKGIVVAVNAKLAEMKQLKSDVDLEISQKVDEAVRKELYQFKVLNDSQKNLLISSNKEALDQKQKEITFIIDAKIAELKQYNKQLMDTLKIIDDAKKQQESSLAEINLALSEAKKTKSQLIVEVNSEMIKTKSQAQSFIDSASLQIQQMDERVNKTLELEKNIAEGMLAQAEQKIEQLTISRADELISKMEVELNNLQSVSKKISPELLDQKIQTIEKFKQEFITNMQTNLAQINSAINELNKKNELAQSTLEEKTLAIDAKMEELTKFENQFTQMMDSILSKN